MKNSESKHKYIEAFKRVEKTLKRIACVSADTTQYKDILDKAKQNNPAVAYFEGLLWDLYGLRNVFAHADRDKYIAEVNSLAFEKMDEILKILTKPPRADVLFKADVLCATTEDIAETVLRQMNEKLYTHIPVYNGSKFIGVLSETTILEWLVENIKEGRAQFYKGKVADINRKYLNSNRNIHKFVSADTSVFEIQKMFDDSIKQGKRLGVIFITNSGKKDERPVGIVTAWDLPKINDFLKTRL